MLDTHKEMQTYAARRTVAKRALTLTTRAIARVEELLQNNNLAIGIQIGVRRRGCNGLSYTMDYVYNENDLDGVERVANGNTTVYIQPSALLHVIGSEMDYVNTQLTSEFSFSNPNTTGVCGCGESFSV